MERNRIFYEYSFDTGISYKTYSSRTEMIYKARAFLKDVKLGEELLPDDIMFHAESGFENSKHTYIRTAGKETVLEFKISEDFSDLRLDLNYETYNGIQPVKLYANDVLAAEFEANGHEAKSIMIPGEYVTDGNLRLQFYFENAVLPAEIDLDNKGRNKLALEFYSIRLSDASM